MHELGNNIIVNHYLIYSVKLFFFYLFKFNIYKVKILMLIIIKF